MNVGHDATERGDTTCRQRLTDEDGGMEWIEWAKTIAKSRRTFKSEEDNDRGRSVSGDNGTFLVQGDLHERSSLVDIIVKSSMALGEIFAKLFFGNAERNTFP